MSPSLAAARILCIFALLCPAEAAWAQESDPDAGVADAAIVEDPQQAERDELNAAREALSVLERGNRPALDPTELLGCDPVDPESVILRLSELKEELDALRGAMETAVVEPPAVDAGVEEVDVVVEAIDAGVAEAAEPPSTEAIAPAAPPTVEALRIEVLERSIAFLERPLHERALAVAHDEESRQLAQELARSAEDVERAQVAADEAGEAREVALAEARLAAEAAARELGEERARALAVKRDLAETSGVQAHERERLARMGRKWSALVSEINLVVTHGEPTTDVADSLYDQVVVALDQSRGAFDRALSAIDAPSAHPIYELSLDLSAARYRAHPTEREDLLRVVREVGEMRDEVVASEVRFRWNRARTLAEHVKSLDSARRELLPHTGESKRQRLLSLGPEGINQIKREAYHLSLMARWYARTRPAELAELPGFLGDSLAHSSSRWILIQLMILIVLALFLVVRREALALRVREVLLDNADTPDSMAVADQWARTFAALAVPAALLATIYIGLSLAAKLGEPAELVLFGAIAKAVAWYGAIISLLHYAIVSITRARRADIPPALSRRILSSLRLVAGYALFAVVLTILDLHLVGRGYIQELVAEFAWIGTIPLLFIILRQWRVEVTNIYGQLYPASGLSRLLERGRDRFWSTFVVLPAAARLAVHGLTTLVQDTALRFDRIRRALAYLFRRRLERTAEALGHGTADVTQLPIALRRAFEPGELTADAKVERFPALEEVLDRVSEWKSGGAGMSLALVGPTGVGKTTWIRELKLRAGDVEIVERTLDDSLEDERAVCVALAKTFALEEIPDTAEALIETLNEMPPKMVLLDHGQNLHLRCVGGLEGLRTFAVIVRRTSQRFFWVSVFSQYAFEHISYVAGGTRSLFMRVEKLGGWTEEELGQLIDRRMEHAGLEVKYDDLLPRSIRDVEREAELERTRHRYLRLLWDYTDGLPRVALYYWLRSLVLGDGDAVMVRLFDAPDADDLEHLDPSARFLLHAIITHENLSVAEAVRVLAMPEDELSSLFEILRLEGYLTRHGDRYRVTTRWDRAVVSYLRRKHLLYT
jgi:hypothetical protein